MYTYIKHLAHCRGVGRASVPSRRESEDFLLLDLAETLLADPTNFRDDAPGSIAGSEASGDEGSFTHIDAFDCVHAADEEQMFESMRLV
jgi:hypothetical protein